MWISNTYPTVVIIISSRMYVLVYMKCFINKTNTASSKDLRNSFRISFKSNQHPLLQFIAIYKKNMYQS